MKRLNVFSLWLAYIIVGLGIAFLINFNPSTDQLWILGSIAIGIGVTWLLNHIAVNTTTKKRKRG